MSRRGIALRVLGKTCLRLAEGKPAGEFPVTNLDLLLGPLLSTVLGKTRDGQEVRLGDEVLATYGRSRGRRLRGWVPVVGRVSRASAPVPLGEGRDFWVLDPEDGVEVATEGGAEDVREPTCLSARPG